MRDLVALGCHVTVVARSEASRQRAAEAGAVALVDRLSALPAVAGVVVATPTSTHAAVVQALLSREVPLFVEKPLTCDEESAAAIVAAAGERVFVMHKWWYHPGVQELARIAASGELGAVQGLRMQHLSWGQPHDDVDVLWILAPHGLSIAQAVLRELPALRGAVAEVNPAGAVTHCYAWFGAQPYLSLEVSANSPERRRWFALSCAQGVAVLADGYASSVTVHRPTGDGLDMASEDRPLSAELPLLRELAWFVDHLRGGPPPPTDAAAGLAVVRAVAAIRRAAGVAP
ncbi:MAG: Gfo/Idh/MocA family oxidoreductase [Fimbriimonadaceae bacterium]|nr:Gfo/Idh/MocA family oxidoreductase [Fimbriimonadaceae bacterium]